MGEKVMKGNARKVRRLHDDKVLRASQAELPMLFTLFEYFEKKLEEYGNLTRGCHRASKGLEE
ncbi:MAG: hypothetical protein CM1200mP36_10310 [Gammaproteobacteria bacterium]|nr:MAG: hypothetical protein CM1200mP36_10310 [Gammaproteobacteria bacterium]